MWDAVLSVCGFVFFVALLPAIARRQPPAPWTCALTSATLCTVAFSDAMLGLRLAGASTALVAVGWLILLAQAMGGQNGVH